MTATGQRALRLRFGLLPLERFPILAGNYREQFVPRFIPLRQRALGARAARVFGVLLDEAAHSVLLAEIHQRDQIDHRRIALAFELVEFVEDERDAATHARREVATGAAEHDDGAARHVFAAVVADTFDDCDRAAVPYREPLAGDAGEVRFAGCRSVQHGVADENRLIGNELRGARVPDDKAAAGKSLADVVVGFALQLERESARGKRAEALATRSSEPE